MEITTIQPFLKYFSNIRSRTLKVVECIPPDQVEWSYKRGAFSFGDTVRHLAAIERWMYAENVQGKPSRYNGCGKGLAEGYDAVLALIHRLHDESMNIFSALTDDNLQKPCTTPANIQIPTWKWLRAMTEHEIHHRGQLYTYLGMIDVPSPPIFGLTSEEVIERSVKE